MNTEFTILEPHHKEYKSGKLFFEYKDNQPTLKRICFVIDKEKYYINAGLTNNTRYATTWLFIKKDSLHAPSVSEINKMVLLAEDILQNYDLKKGLIYLLSTIKPQSEIFLKLMDKNLDKDEKEKLKKQLRKQNWVINRYNSSYRKCSSYRDPKEANKTLDK